MKVILTKINQAVKQLNSKLVNKLNYQVHNLANRRCSSANGLFTSEIVGAVTSLIFVRDGSCRLLSSPAQAFAGVPLQSRHPSGRLNKLVIAMITLLTLSFGVFLSTMFSSSASATSLDINIASNIALDLMPSVNGTFASSDTSVNTVSVKTNNYAGYTLSIAASVADSTDLIYADNSTTIDTIPSISSAVSASDYDNDTYAANNNLNNTWGFRPSKYNSTDNTDYLPIPSSTTPTTLDATSSPNASAANTYNIAIGARVDLAKTPGSYTNTFIITVLANPTPYTITYNQNTTDTVSNMPANITNGTSYADTVSLGTTTPTRTGYTFVGWCNAAEATNESTCSGTLYNTTNNNLSDYPIDRTASSNNVSVSAIWTVNQYTCTKQYRLQTATAGWGSYTTDTTEQVNYGATCSYTKIMTDYKGSSSASNGASGTATCTVTENGCTASIDFYRNTYALTINRNTTYISSVSGAGTYRWGQSVAISATASSGNEFTSWSQTSGTTGSFGSTSSASTTFTMPKSAATIYAEGKSSKKYMWDATSADCGQTLYDNRDGTERAYTTAKIGSLCWMTTNLALGKSTTTVLTNSNTNLNGSLTSYTLPASSTSGFSSNSAQNIYNSGSTTCGNNSPCYGYYTYAAATAGTNPSSGAASSDICPKGWRLPTQAEFNTLVSSYNTGAKLVASPFLGVYAGGYYSSSFSTGGSYGFYWSSTAYDSNYAYYLRFNSSNAYVNYNSKYYGGSIRCVAKS